MAARTETGRLEAITGHMRMVTGTFADIDDTDTWTPGLSIIHNLIINNESANPTATEVNATWTTPANRQAVVTFDTEAANNLLRVTALGQ